LLTLAQYDRNKLGEECQSEIKDMAAVMPRMYGGYTELTAKNSSAHFMVELRNDIASGLSTLVAPVQGMGVAKGDLFSFGMSLDVAAAHEFIGARLDAMEAAPFKCELFAELQAGVPQGRAMLQQPLPPIAYSIKGFYATVDSVEGLDMATKQPPTSIDASFLLAVDNPQGLLAMGQMFSPELAQLDVQPDGKPTRLTLPPISPALNDAFLAMTENSLAISVGAKGEAELVELLKSGYAEPSPFISMNMDGESYYGFIADSMEIAGQEQAAKGEGSPEVTAALKRVMESFKGMLGQMTFDVEFTSRGIEMRSDTELMPEK
jgi:hypothetical protein